MKKISKKAKLHKSSRDYTGRLLNENTPFAAMEAFKTLRTNLMFTAAGKSTPVFGVVSSFPNTGKSLISANTAIAFSMANKKALLIDCDMRKPVQHKCFKVRNETGVSELLSGQATYEEVIRPAPGYENLYLMTSGHIPPNPQELLSSESMTEMIENLKNAFDVIILDLPPIGVVADAMTIAKQVTGYMFVVHAGESEKNAVKMTIAKMQSMECNIAGIVLNFVDLKSGSYYKSSYYNSYYYSDSQPL